MGRYINVETDYDPLILYDLENEVFNDVENSFIRSIDRKNFLYRGSSKGIDGYEFIKPRQVRSSYMNKKTKDIINKMLYPKFGWNVRDGVFTTGNMSNAEDFGESYLFFPVDDYKFVWSTKLEDINYDDDFLKLDKLISDNIPESEERFIEWFKPYVKSFTDTDLKNAIRSGHEIMFKCNKYVLIDKYYTDIVIREIL